MRTAPEEFNLSANQHTQDPYTAEFFRSYRTMTFAGKRFVDLIDSEMKADPHRTRRGLLPVRDRPVEQEVIKTFHIEDYVSQGR